MDDVQYYSFEDAPNKVNPASNLKKQTNETRGVWNLLKELGLQFYGVVRDYSAIFGLNGTYVVLHHFLEKEPLDDLFGAESSFSFSRIPLGGGLFDFIDALNMRAPIVSVIHCVLSILLILLYWQICMTPYLILMV
jgi:hypothetical protein